MSTVYSAALEKIQTEDDFPVYGIVAPYCYSVWNDGLFDLFLSIDEYDYDIFGEIENVDKSSRAYAVQDLPENAVILARTDGSPYEVWWSDEDPKQDFSDAGL